MTDQNAPVRRHERHAHNHLAELTARREQLQQLAQQHLQQTPPANTGEQQPAGAGRQEG